MSRYCHGVFVFPIIQTRAGNTVGFAVTLTLILRQTRIYHHIPHLWDTGREYLAHTLAHLTPIRWRAMQRDPLLDSYAHVCSVSMVGSECSSRVEDPIIGKLKKHIGASLSISAVGLSRSWKT